MKEKTCFVAIGFGPKTDYETGRVLDLDKTYDNLIKPVFDDLGIKCFRAKELKHSGVIDKPMYEWLLNADIVVADISTLNPNAIYELGVRHALRPYSTIVISENKLKYPFDVNHVVIESYEHLGPDIGVTEAKRFTAALKEKVQEIIARNEDDSPVYTFLTGLTPPAFKDDKFEAQVKEIKAEEQEFSNLIKEAEEAKNNKDFTTAKGLFKFALKLDPHNIFLKQRLALVTYKANEEDEATLKAAEEILADLNPEETTDPETLGLSGAINKRLYEVTGDEKCLDKAIWFYERGFYVKQDYYNGINFAYLLNVKALTVKDEFEAISFYLQANRVREKVIEFCKNLIGSDNFNERGDRQWIYQSLAQAYLGLGRKDEVEKLVPKIMELSKGEFDLDTFYKQNEKLTQHLDDFKKKRNYP